MHPNRVAGRPAGVELQVVGLAKAFGHTLALDDCSLQLRGGQVQGLVGENGSGKSTLAKIIAGVHRPDRGTIELDGRTLAGFRSPRQALQAGIAVVHQDLLLARGRPLLDNILLGPGPLLHTDAEQRRHRSRATAVLQQLTGAEPDLDRPVERLPLSHRHACCVARALARSPRILLLDEPSACLDLEMRERLLAVLRDFADAGNCAVVISHRLDEIEQAADLVTVLRAGRTVATLARGETSPDNLLRHMAPSLGRADGQTRPRRIPGDVVLRAHGIRLRPDGPPVELALRAGETVGIAGLDGNGQDAFLRALRGEHPHGGVVTREVGGRSVPIRSLRAAAHAGIAYVPGDRAGEGVFGSRPAWENFALPTLRRDTVAGWLRPAAGARRLATYVSRLRIRLAAAAAPIRTLSGGNQQKVVFARWLAFGPAILLLDDPTRGVDPGTKRDVHQLLAELAADAVAIVLLSTELDELVRVADRVLVF
ncbi:MAG TPA: sugar ABC transporter ATP-binding protein, partial [Actinoplanes sp.]|nr:sugar ABC transporter ATP-binding protein [Actinoplanes sp.]